MELKQAFEVFYGVWFIVLGVSLFTAHHQWKKQIAFWLEHPEQYFVLAFVFLPIGVFTILLHNVWHGAAVIVTLLGWIVTIKACLMFCMPSLLYRFVNTTWLKRKLFILMSLVYTIVGILILGSTLW